MFSKKSNPSAAASSASTNPKDLKDFKSSVSKPAEQEKQRARERQLASQFLCDEIFNPFKFEISSNAKFDSVAGTENITIKIIPVEFEKLNSVFNKIFKNVPGQKNITYFESEGYFVTNVGTMNDEDIRKVLKNRREMLGSLIDTEIREAKDENTITFLLNTLEEVNRHDKAKKFIEDMLGEYKKSIGSIDEKSKVVLVDKDFGEGIFVEIFKPADARKLLTNSFTVNIERLNDDNIQKQIKKNYDEKFIELLKAKLDQMRNILKAYENQFAKIKDLNEWQKKDFLSGGPAPYEKKVLTETIPACIETITKLKQAIFKNEIAFIKDVLSPIMEIGDIKLEPMLCNNKECIGIRSNAAGISVVGGFFRGIIESHGDGVIYVKQKELNDAKTQNEIRGGNLAETIELILHIHQTQHANDPDFQKTKEILEKMKTEIDENQITPPGGLIAQKRF